MQLVQIQEQELRRKAGASLHSSLRKCSDRNSGARTTTRRSSFAAKSGDGHAFGILVKRYQREDSSGGPALHRIERMQKTSQQSFQKAFVHLHKFEGKSCFSTWLTRIAINEALMFLRRVRAYGRYR